MIARANTPNYRRSEPTLDDVPNFPAGRCGAESAAGFVVLLVGVGVFLGFLWMVTR